jgi:hypothetical protein
MGGEEELPPGNEKKNEYFEIQAYRQQVLEKDFFVLF